MRMFCMASFIGRMYNRCKSDKMIVSTTSSTSKYK